MNLNPPSRSFRRLLSGIALIGLLAVLIFRYLGVMEPKEVEPESAFDNLHTPQGVDPQPQRLHNPIPPPIPRKPTLSGY